VSVVVQMRGYVPMVRGLAVAIGGTRIRERMQTDIQPADEIFRFDSFAKGGLCGQLVVIRKRGAMGILTVIQRCDVKCFVANRHRYNGRATGGYGGLAGSGSTCAQAQRFGSIIPQRFPRGEIILLIS